MNNATNNANMKTRMIGVGMVTGGMLAAALGSAASNSWLGISMMTIGILSIGIVIGFDIGIRQARKEAREAVL